MYHDILWKTHCWSLWNSPCFLSQLDCSQHCLLAWSHTWKGELLLPREQAEGNQESSAPVEPSAEPRGLVPSTGKGTETQWWHTWVAPVLSTVRGQINALSSRFRVTAPVFHHWCLTPHPKQHRNELFSVTSRQIEKWEVPLEGLASAPQKLLGMNRKDSESGSMFRSKPLALIGHPGIH